MMRARKAKATDAPAIYALIAHYSSQGLLLPRAEEEIREHVSRFLVVAEGEKILGCVALEPYGNDLAEVRSLAVAPEAQRHGMGARMLRYSLAVAKRRKIARIFAVTHAPHVFEKHGFVAGSRHAIPEKIEHDCKTCPKQKSCQLVAVVATVIPDRVALPVLHTSAVAVPA
ncbi:MAG: GNAT family N-acetyltransferase [Acidobacteria bacterium]|nr:GNAT family N-acetyltransferase [Acidobacteriota bacterium]